MQWDFIDPGCAAVFGDSRAEHPRASRRSHRVLIGRPVRRTRIKSPILWRSKAPTISTTSSVIAASRRLNLRNFRVAASRNICGNGCTGGAVRILLDIGHEEMRNAVMKTLPERLRTESGA